MTVKGAGTAQAITADLKRVVCGIDGSPQSRGAIRQAIEVGAPDARVWGVSVWDPGLAMRGGIHTAEVASSLREQSDAALAVATDAYPKINPVQVEGASAPSLLEAAKRFDADLISVGSHGTSRLPGILLGSVATAVVHDSPCSVLLARGDRGEAFPKMILHANDGSAESRFAAGLTAGLAVRHDASVITVHVHQYEDTPEAVVAQAAALGEAIGIEQLIRSERGLAHKKIVEIAKEIDASLIVMGSRGLTGARALGSVSERVAHHASCSVLIARYPHHANHDSGLS